MSLIKPCGEWGPAGYKFISHKNVLTFSKKIGIFIKMGVSPKNKRLYFLRMALDTAFTKLF